MFSMMLVHEVAPKIMPAPDSDPVHVVASPDPAPTVKNVATAADPVNLFNGEFAYSVAEIQSESCVTPPCPRPVAPTNAARGCPRRR
jgi:hypothetical protein